MNPGAYHLSAARELAMVATGFVWPLVLDEVIQPLSYPLGEGDAGRDQAPHHWRVVKGVGRGSC